MREFACVHVSCFFVRVLKVVFAGSIMYLLLLIKELFFPMANLLVIINVCVWEEWWCTQRALISTNNEIYLTLILQTEISFNLKMDSF